MTDPFEVLRRSADARAGATVEIDPRFRAELLDEARHRLTGAPGAARRQVTSTFDIDEPTEIPVMPSDRPRWARRMLLAAACVVLITGTMLAVTTLERSDGDEPAATQTLTDEQLVAAIKLDLADLGMSRVALDVIDSDYSDLFGLGRYWSRRECSAFEQVFKPLESSTHGLRTFGRPPSQPAVQRVVVFADEATASAVFDGWVDPKFARCLQLNEYQFVFRFGAPSKPPFTMSADDFAYYTYEQPGGQINAGGVVRVGRTLTFVEASITWQEPAVPLMSEDEFGRIIDRVVARAKAALSGTPSPTATTTP